MCVCAFVKLVFAIGNQTCRRIDIIHVVLIILEAVGSERDIL